ncbi:Uu.00g139030.m01.CDS01 [Anthostomella pinea]|uniref:Uu.00g139030.m01.CDS01 n=1 Tax=Anthostomella pinea TaxID=933095 RepID=A0AAI8VR07_9PEZI|nr:Uu.00g139030.m01.CDS01 [Anthostomella pinea]
MIRRLKQGHAELKDHINEVAFTIGTLPTPSTDEQNQGQAKLEKASRSASLRWRRECRDLSTLEAMLEERKVAGEQAPMENPAEEDQR